MSKKIAWGASELLKMYLAESESNQFVCCIDDFSIESDICGLPIKNSNLLTNEEKNSFQIVIFAVSNKSLQEISGKLNVLGLSYKKNFIYYSDFFYDNFKELAEKNLGFSLNPKFYQFALSFTLNSKFLIHTTILGTWLFLEILNSLNKVKGAIAEVGAFEGGNSLCALQFMAKLNYKKFYIFDSFSGFPELSKYDPNNFKKGDYNIETSFEKVKDIFSIFKEAVLIKGFVPGIFSKISKEEKFSLVFYDCDIYKPALDTFNFFWERIVSGGYLLVHDYETVKGGFTGVKKATEEFFRDKNVRQFSFKENTMAVIKKE